jgi:hypothetical protein
MARGLGIGALVIGILSLTVPVISLYVVWLALLLAAVAAVAGDKTFAIATFAICLVNVLFLSPATWLAFAGEQHAGGIALRLLTTILFAAPLAILVIGALRTRPPRSAV